MTVHPLRIELVIVELATVVCESVELESVTPSKETSVRVQGSVRVEFCIVDVPVIPSSVEEASVGKYDA